MKKTLLISLLLLNTVGLVACSDDKKDDNKSVKEKLHDCLWDQTGNCQDQLSSAMNDPSKRAFIEKEMAEHPGLAEKLNSGKMTGMDWQAVQAHAEQVKAKTVAISNDPNSSFYEPPVSRTAASVDHGVDPAVAQVIANTPNAPVAVLPASVGSDSSNSGASQ